MPKLTSASRGYLSEDSSRSACCRGPGLVPLASQQRVRWTRWEGGVCVCACCPPLAACHSNLGQLQWCSITARSNHGFLLPGSSHPSQPHDAVEACQIKSFSLSQHGRRRLGRCGRSARPAKRLGPLSMARDPLGDPLRSCAAVSRREAAPSACRAGNFPEPNSLSLPPLLLLPGRSVISRERAPGPSALKAIQPRSLALVGGCLVGAQFASRCWAPAHTGPSASREPKIPPLYELRRRSCIHDTTFFLRLFQLDNRRCRRSGMEMHDPKGLYRCSQSMSSPCYPPSQLYLGLKVPRTEAVGSPSAAPQRS
ncbi:hypothetical protein B0T14DRAFT_264552 [Immersiella caudata]|uniref:Uncharacterized protein n=1 Tax=Immersiella caudata TaxID=314043 RepID=A0AA40BXJ4_9PEZI|nr:hypothetical protein B0T14DRAFT_264552 [Immersiella caudata]